MSLNPPLPSPLPVDPNQFQGAEGFSLALLQLQQQIQQTQLQQQTIQQQSALANPVKRRVWIKREGAVPTTVFVDVDDLIGKLLLS